MAGRGFAAVLVIAAALVPLIASAGAAAQPGDENQCVGGTATSEDGSQMCTITMSPGKCIQKSSSPAIVQTCVVNQTGPRNEVYVEQVNNSKSGSTQDGTQIVEINQAGVDNIATVKQDIKQSTHELSDTGMQKQDGRQTTTICQGGAGDPCANTNTGTNTATVNQQRWADAHASGGNITQAQDTAAGTNCPSPNPPAAPNLCALVEQNSTVRNDADLQQQDHLLAEASGTGTITQKQGVPEAGIDGHVVQQTATGAPQNTENAHQHLTYDLSAPDNAMQSQDPRVGGGSPGGKLNLHQVGILRASSDGAFQHLGINGVCVATESCLILEHAKVNGGNFTTRCRQEAGPCARFIECTSPAEEGEPCIGGGPPIIIDDLAIIGFDALDFQNAINFTYPVTLPGL